MKEYIDALQKQYKDSFIISGCSSKLNIERISTGSLTLDRVLGGGLPKGKMCVFYGKEMSGKTTTALLCLKGKSKVAYVDLEKSFDPKWAKKLGVSISDIMVIRPSAGEIAFDIVTNLLKNEFDVVVVDSIAALVPSSEIQRDFTKGIQVGSQAQLINYGIRRLNLANKNTCLILINQVREKIGQMFGNPEHMPGGKAIYFIPHVRLKFYKGDWLEENGKRVGIEVRIMVEKNKFGECQRDVHYNLYWAGYIDNKEEKFQIMLDDGEIKQKGAWYYWNEKKFQGKEELIKKL